MGSYVQKWVCPRVPEHPPYKSPVFCIEVACGLCAQAATHKAGRVVAPAEIAMKLVEEVQPI